MKRGQKSSRNKFYHRPPVNRHKPSFVWVKKSNDEPQKEEILKDSGIGGVVATYELFYEKLPTADFVNSPLNPFVLVNSFRCLCGYGTHLALNGLKYCKEDAAQSELFNAAVYRATDLGVPCPSELQRQRHQIIFFSPETLVGALALFLRWGVDPTLPIPDGRFDLQDLATILLKINDFKYPGVHANRPSTDEFKLDMIRQYLIQAPFTGVKQTFMKRVVRFYEIHSSVLQSSEPEFIKQVDSYLIQQVGVGFEDLLSLIIPLNSAWISAKVIGPIYFETTGENPKMWSKILSFLDKVALTPLSYKDHFEELHRRLGDNFFASSFAMAKLVSSPFLKVSDHSHLLLAPFLLLRSIELAVLSAFIQFRPKETTQIQDLYGPLGKAFEHYCCEILDRGVTASRISSLVLSKNPNNPGTKNELCDSLIEFEKACIVFEFKYRVPPLRALEALDGSLDEIKKWIHETYLLSSSEAKKVNKSKTRGALNQLEEACHHLENGVRGNAIDTIVPVVVISEEFITFLQLYEYLDKKVEEEKIFQANAKVSPFLLMSVGDLELLASVDFSKSRWNLATVLIEKSVKKEARIMHWGKFFDRLGLKYKVDATREKKYDELYQKAVAHFES